MSLERRRLGSLRVRPMSETVDDTIREYARRSSAHDAEGVTELCMAPFLAIRGGVPIHLVERDDVRATSKR